MGDGGARGSALALVPRVPAETLSKHTVEQAYMLMPWRLLLRLRFLGGKFISQFKHDLILFTHFYKGSVPPTPAQKKNI